MGRAGAVGGARYMTAAVAGSRAHKMPKKKWGTDQPTDRPTDGHDLVWRCVHASKKKKNLTAFF